MKARNILTVVLAVVVAILISGCAKSELQMLKNKVNKSPNEPSTHINLAYYYRNNGKLNEALQEYDAALKIRPDDFMALMNKGEVLFSLKRYQDALAVFVPLVKKKPNDSVLHNNIAMCYHQMGRIREALAAYNQALKLNPRNEPALKGLEFLKQDIKVIQEKVNKAQKNPKQVEKKKAK
jgi:tetratricopeptide (TPR) repeat protein